jgi:hypothetical protein
MNEIPIVVFDVKLSNEGISKATKKVPKGFMSSNVYVPCRVWD